MSKYFKLFPTLNYKVANSSFTVEKVITNFTLRTKIIDNINNKDPYFFMPYTVHDGERPEDVANFYYESPHFVWLVYMSNNIIDPYTQWPMSERTFKKYIGNKYEVLAGNTDPIAWTQDNTITDNVVHYQLSTNTNITISKDSYTVAQTFDSDFVPGDWSAVRYYDWERDKNEQRRNIRLVHEQYAGSALTQLKRLINGRN